MIQITSRVINGAISLAYPVEHFARRSIESVVKCHASVTRDPFRQSCVSWPISAYKDTSYELIICTLNAGCLSVRFH